MLAQDSSFSSTFPHIEAPAVRVAATRWYNSTQTVPPSVKAIVGCVLWLCGTCSSEVWHTQHHGQRNFDRCQPGCVLHPQHSELLQLWRLLCLKPGHTAAHTSQLNDACNRRHGKSTRMLRAPSCLCASVVCTSNGGFSRWRNLAILWCARAPGFRRLAAGSWLPCSAATPQSRLLFACHCKLRFTQCLPQIQSIEPKIA